MGRTACTEPQCLYKGALYLYYTRPEPLWWDGVGCDRHALGAISPGKKPGAHCTGG